MRPTLLSLAVLFTGSLLCGCGGSGSESTVIARNSNGGGGNNSGGGIVRNTARPAVSPNNSRPHVRPEPTTAPTIEREPQSPDPDEPIEEPTPTPENPADTPDSTPADDPNSPSPTVAMEEKIHDSERSIVKLLRESGAEVLVKDNHAVSITVKAENKFGDSEALFLSRLQQMTYLGLSGAKITNEGMGYISALKDVTTILLNDTNIDDTGLSHLLKMPKLARIGIDNTFFSPEIHRQLLEAYPNSNIEGEPNKKMMVASSPLPGKPGSTNSAMRTEKLQEFAPGSAEDAVQKVVLAIRDNNFEGMSEFISKSGKDDLSLIRENKLGERKLGYLQQVFKNIVLPQPARKSGSRRLATLYNNKNQLMIFTLKEEQSIWKISKLEIKPANGVGMQFFAMEEGMDPALDPTMTEEGNASAIPTAEPGSAEEAVQKVCLALKSGELKGLTEYISSRSTNNDLRAIRSGKITSRRLTYYQRLLEGANLNNQQRTSNNTRLIVLLNKWEQQLKFSCQQDSDIWKVRDLKVVNKN